MSSVKAEDLVVEADSVTPPAVVAVVVEVNPY